MTDPTRIGGVPPSLHADQTDPSQRTGPARQASPNSASHQVSKQAGIPGNSSASSAGHSTNSSVSSSSFAELLRARQGVADSQSTYGKLSGTQPGTDSSDLRFSAHAQTRLQSRHIELQAGHLDRLQSAVGRAAAKGSKDALVLMDDMAFVVSVTNRTVVTVVDKDNMKQNVFTNIDSAVVA